MAGSVNKVILIGRLGRDPEKRSFNNGGSVVNLSVATSESWKDKASGERKELTEWHRVAIFNEKLGEIADKYLKKGSAVYLEGKIQTRSYEKDGETRYATEIVLARFGGELTLLDSKGSGGESGGGGEAAPREQRQKEPAGGSFVEDEIPW